LTTDATKSNSRKNLASSAKSGFKKLSVRSVVIYLMQLISTLILSRFLIPKDYGIFGIIQNWLGSGNYLTDIGLTDGLIQQKEEISKEQLSAYLFVRLTLATLVASCFFIGIFFFHEKLGIEIGKQYLICFLGLLSLLEVLSASPKMIFQKTMNFDRLAKMEISSSISLYVFQIIFAVSGFGFWSMFAGILIRYFVIIGVGFRSGCYTIPKYKNLQSVKHLYRRGAFYQLNLGVVFVVGIITPILLKSYLSMHDVGLYFWSIGLVSIPMSIIFNFQNVVFPAISKIQDNVDEVKILFNRGSELFLLIIFLLFGLGATLSIPLVDLLFNEKWYGAKEFISAISFIFIFYSVRQIPMVLLTSLGKSLEKFMAELSFLVSLVLSSIYLLPEYGIMGFIYASVFSHLVAFIIGISFCSSFFYASFYHNLFTLIIALGSAFFQIHKLGLSGSLVWSLILFVVNMIVIMALLNRKLLKSCLGQLKR
tara:strand:+ start:113787 stop:115226 length:1440 start_codon:yes stop_codon:yes gene_type:complete